MWPLQDRLLLLRAAAGSGKTYQLSNRYLQLLRAGADPGSIVASTFTRKAAAEICGRVLTRLAGAALDESDAQQLATDLAAPTLCRMDAEMMLANLAQSIHRVGISTIDALLGRMAGCARWELGLPSRPRVLEDDGPVARELRRRAVEAMLADDDPDVLVSLLRRLHHGESHRRISDALEQLFADLYEVYRQTGPKAWDALVVPDTLSEAQVSSALVMLGEARCHLPADRRWHAAFDQDLGRATRRDWPEFLGSSQSLTARSVEQNACYYRQPFPSALVTAYRPLVIHAQAFVVGQVAQRTKAMRQLLDRFESQYRRLCRQSGVLLLGDVPYLLGGPLNEMIGLDELYYRLDGRIQHLLLDEFQDTSVAQWRVLEPLAQEICQDSGGGRTFFCVGDVKQSIYGWRGGCPQLFEHLISCLHLPAESVQSLTLSYRSAPVLLDVVNDLFTHIGDASPMAALREHALSWQQGFSHHESAHADQPGFFELLASPSDANHDDFVVEKIAILAGQHPTRTIGVLMVTNMRAVEILRRLRVRGIHAAGDGGSTLDTDPAVELILSALTLVDHPGHSAAAIHVVQSPLAEVFGLDTIDPQQVDEAARRIRRELIDHGYGAVLTRWILALRPVLGPRSAERLTQMIQLADRSEPLSRLRASEFIRVVRETRVDEPAPAPVRVMTIHKAKGLQFDIVVLGQMDEPIGWLGAQLIWRFRQVPTEEPVAVFGAFKQALRNVIEPVVPTIHAAHSQEVAARVSDDLSAFYVAMTRARYALHLILKPLTCRADGTIGAKGNTNASPSSICRQRLTDMTDPPLDGLLAQRGDRSWDRRRLVSPVVPSPHLTPPCRPRLCPAGAERRWWQTIRPSRLADAGGGDPLRLLDLKIRSAMRRGSRLHDLLATIDYLPTDRPAPELEQVLHHEAVRRVLSRRYGNELLWRERSFAVALEGLVLHGIFDRVAIEQDDRGWASRAVLIDFKTELYSDAAVGLYQLQLKSYRRALSSLLGLDEHLVAAELLFVNDGVSVQL